MRPSEKFLQYTLSDVFRYDESNPTLADLTRTLTTGQDKILGIKFPLSIFLLEDSYATHPALHFLLPYRIIIIIITIEICSQRKHQIKDIKKRKS